MTKLTTLYHSDSLISENLELNTFSNFSSPSNHNEFITATDSQIECDTDENPIEDVLLPSQAKIFENHIPNRGEICYSYIKKSDFFASVTPDYLTVAQGMNFEIVCHNLNCKNFEDCVYVHLGMCLESSQICHYVEYMFEVLCPICCMQIKPEYIHRIIFVNCAVKIKFKKSIEITFKEFELVALDDNYICIDVIKGIDKYNYFKFTLS